MSSSNPAKWVRNRKCPLGSVLWFHFLGCIIFTLASIAMAETGEPPDPQAVKRGQPLYEKHCASCHGENGIGEPSIPWHIMAPDYYVAPALDDSQHAWHHSDEDLVEMILKGSIRSNRMAAWESILGEQDARDLVAYIKSLWDAWALDCQGPKHMECMSH